MTDRSNKAREIVKHLAGSDECVTSDVKFVAAALLSAQNEAYERAAQVADDHPIDNGPCVAAAIRQLKDKGE